MSLVNWVQYDCIQYMRYSGLLNLYRRLLPDITKDRFRYSAVTVDKHKLRATGKYSKDPLTTQSDPHTSAPYLLLVLLPIHSIILGDLGCVSFKLTFGNIQNCPETSFAKIATVYQHIVTLLRANSTQSRNEQPRLHVKSSSPRIIYKNLSRRKSFILDVSDSVRKSMWTLHDKLFRFICLKRKVE